MSYNSGVIVLVTSNRPRAARLADLKLLARLLPKLYSTQSSYHYLTIILSAFDVYEVIVDEAKGRINNHLIEIESLLKFASNNGLQ